MNRHTFSKSKKVHMIASRSSDGQYPRCLTKMWSKNKASSLSLIRNNHENKDAFDKVMFVTPKSPLFHFRKETRFVTFVSKPNSFRGADASRGSFPRGERDSSNYTDKDKVVSITYEEIGLFPRSFSRVLDRFLKQLFSDVDNLVIQEYRFYRYLFLTTIKTIFILFFVPFLVNFAAKNYIVKPITEYFWNTSHPEIFLNSYEQKRAFAELEKFEEKIYFETLVLSHSQQHSTGFRENGPGFSVDYSKPSQQLLSGQQELQSTKIMRANEKEPVPASLGQFPEGEPANNEEMRPIISNMGQQPLLLGSVFNVIKENSLSNEYNTTIETSISPVLTQITKAETVLPLGETMRNNFIGSPTGVSLTTVRKNKDISKIYQEKTIELATYYNNHSIEAITNFFADLLSLCTLLYLLITLEIQINITKSFLLEVFFGLDDSKKSLLILLITDLLVGYHSSNLWELFFEFIFNHYGIPESQTGIFLLVATLPVLLDVLFKYLIFRHLNRSSPATVATYQAIIE
jgi:CemA family